MKEFCQCVKFDGVITKTWGIFVIGMFYISVGFHHVVGSKQHWR